MAKRKAAITTIIVCLALSAGTAFAVGNPVEVLEQWYNARLQYSLDTIKGDTEMHLAAKTTELQQYTEDLVNKSMSEIDNASISAIDSASKNITDYSDRYINQLTVKKAELEATIDNEFDSFQEEMKEKVSSEIDSELEAYLKLLINQLD